MLFFAFFGFRSPGKVEMGFGVLYNKGRRRASPAQGGTGLFERFQTVAGALMRDYTTLRLGGPADWLVTPRSAGELIQILAEARDSGIPVTVIGQGSNLLVGDGGIRGLVIRMARGLRACFVQGNLLTADAGAMMGAAAAAAAEAGLSGLEFASGIPGTVGGGALMNAGAYGGEMSRVVQQVTAVRRDGSDAVKDRGGNGIRLPAQRDAGIGRNHHAGCFPPAGRGTAGNPRPDGGIEPAAGGKAAAGCSQRGQYLQAPRRGLRGRAD